MAWRCGSLSRSLLSTARSSSSSFRSSSSSASTSLPRLRPSIPTRPHRLHSRRSLFSTPRNLGELGCVQSLLPLHSAVASTRLTSHISIEARAFCELSQ
ncbi:protein NUCLEAR FUSION DEFECTIVE 6, chloroplastic/mitochondrial-like, partial [Fagus crenata]